MADRDLGSSRESTKLDRDQRHRAGSNPQRISHKARSLLRDHMIPRSIGVGAEMSKSFSKVIQQSSSKAKTRTQGSRFLFHFFLLHENLYKQKRGCHRWNHG